MYLFLFPTTNLLLEAPALKVAHLASSTNQDHSKIFLLLLQISKLYLSTDRQVVNPWLLLFNACVFFTKMQVKDHANS